MEDINRMSSEELKEYILEQLDEMGIAPGTVEVRVLRGPKVVLGGKIDSGRIRDLIIKTVRDMAGIVSVVDELVVAEEEYEDYGEEGMHEECELYDEDNEYMGSEDVFRAVEDGVPYIPPTEPPAGGSSELSERGKKRKKKPGRSG
ncbi:MAG: BON domain-containing protein [Candidatus Omnitrophota bacterium]